MCFASESSASSESSESSDYSTTSMPDTKGSASSTSMPDTKGTAGRRRRSVHADDALDTGDNQETELHRERRWLRSKLGRTSEPMRGNSDFIFNKKPKAHKRNPRSSDGEYKSCQ